MIGSGLKSIGSVVVLEHNYLLFCIMPARGAGRI